MPNHPLSWSEEDVPFSERFADHFYSAADGRAETAYVFLQGNDLPARWSEGGAFTIGELGFGTGLNFLETWRQWVGARQPEGQLTFVSFEGYPLTSDEMATALARWPDLHTLAEPLLVHWTALESGLNTWQMDAQTQLTVVQAEVLDGMAAWNGKADAWYLDGFAPARNPDMWSEDLMQAVADHARPGASFASYTSAGWVRRNLEAAGFEVERVPGFGRKRHMIRGSKR
ncbi:MAG: tRNA (5-methylaminomethyl-2-thiouridine)(34)-methyltransferase MnmD [Pseudomonadota bacterium]